MIYDIYLSNAIGLKPGGNSTVHMYTQTIHRTTQIRTLHNTINYRTTQITNQIVECGRCPLFASYTVAVALHVRKKYGETSVRVAED